MATPAITFAIPSTPIAAAFTGGEHAVAPNTTAAGTFYLAGRVRLAGGQYTLKLWCDDVCTAWIGTEAASTRRIATSRKVDAAPAQVDFFAAAGDYRIDLTLLNLTGATSTYAVFSIWQNGKIVYASTHTGWVYASTPIPDAEIPALGDYRLALPVWTVTPNWVEGVTERLTWLTEILVSEADVEQRRSLRRYPRRSIEASFLRTAVARQRIDNFLAGIGRSRRFLVPLWFEQTRLPAAVSPGSHTVAFPAGTLALREFYVGTLVLLASPADHEVVTVTAITGDVLTLSAPAATWPAGTRITPLQVARFDEFGSISNLTATVGQVQLRFELEEPERHIEPDWGYCAPLWRFKVDRSQALTTDHSRSVYTFDVETGRVETTDVAQTARVAMKAALVLFGRERLWAFRSFAAMARGRAARFWWPSGTHDLEPVGTIDGITLDVAPVAFSEMFTMPQDARVALQFVFNDGRPAIYRRIVDTADMGTFERLTLDAALPPMTRAAIERVSYVLPARFDQDAFELKHVTDNAKAVRAQVVVRSSEIAGMPPIDCWVTSRPYPVQVVDDALNGQAAVTAGRFSGVLPVVESIVPGATITAGSLLTLLRSTTIPAESLNVSAAITAGSFPLTVSYVETTIPPESISATAAITGGTLELRLISLILTTESINVSAAIVAGSLT